MTAASRASDVRTGVTTGLAALAVTVIALAILRPRWVGHGDPDGLAGAVALVGLVPAMFTGVLLARVARFLGDAPRWVRIATLVPPALTIVVVATFAAGVPMLAAFAPVQTLACVVAIERATRPRAPLPLAIAR